MGYPVAYKTESKLYAPSQRPLGFQKAGAVILRPDFSTPSSRAAVQKAIGRAAFKSFMRRLGWVGLGISAAELLHWYLNHVGPAGVSGANWHLYDLTTVVTTPHPLDPDHPLGSVQYVINAPEPAEPWMGITIKTIRVDAPVGGMGTADSKANPGFEIFGKYWTWQGAGADPLFEGYVRVSPTMMVPIPSVHGEPAVIYPMADPMRQPIGQPNPGPRPIPYTVLPYRVLNPDLVEQSEWGNRELPEAATDPLAKPALVPGTAIIAVAERPMTIAPPSGGLPREPRFREKERKKQWSNNPVYRMFAKVAHTFTESQDFVREIYRALPDNRRYCGTYDTICQAEAIYRYADELDIQDAVVNLLLNQFEDFVIGKLSRGAALGAADLEAYGQWKVVQRYIRDNTDVGFELSKQASKLEQDWIK